MPQDAFTLKYLCSELNTVFSGGKINRIIQPSNDEVVFTVYTGKKTERLILDVNPSSPRIGVITAEKNGPLTAPNFCMLLRKHLLSAVIDEIKLVGFDRIVKIDLTASQEFFDAEKKTLYVELMGRYSNVILTENGKILGGNRGINMFDDGVRPLIVGKPYVFPPVQDKLLPWDVNVVTRLKNYASGSVSEYLCQTVQGLAKSTANEIVTVFAENKGVSLQVLENRFVNYAEQFFDFLNNFVMHTELRPCVFEDGETVTDVCVYPYRLQKGKPEYFSTLCEAEDYYFSRRASVKKFKDKKERLTNIVLGAQKKAKKRFNAITVKIKDAEKLEENRIKGELLISNVYRIKQGLSEIELENYYDGGKLLKITLDVNLTAVRNAENYFKKYAKQKRTLVALEPQYVAAKSELDYLDSVLDEIIVCENSEDLDFVAKEMSDYGLIPNVQKSGKKKEEKQTFREYSFDGLTFYVGRNNSENDRLLVVAGKDDIWLHAKDYHSSHAIIIANGKAVSEKAILTAAEVCAFYSKGRESGRVEVVYTARKNVKKPRGSKAGFVTYENYRSILVTPNKREERLKNG